MGSASAIYRLQKAYYSVKKGVLYNILLEFDIHKKVVRLIKMCLKEKYSKVREGKICLINFLFKMA
jgi:hypothetical protein